MDRTIASAIVLRNSEWQFQDAIATDAIRGMSGSDHRVEILRGLVGSHPSIAAFARTHNVDATYISQILNGHRSLGEKAARKMEQAIGLAEGFFEKGSSPNARKSPPPDDFESLLALATPTSRTQLKRIAQAAADGRLTEKDVELLRLIADRFTKRG